MADEDATAYLQGNYGIAPGAPRDGVVYLPGNYGISLKVPRDQAYYLHVNVGVTQGRKQKVVHPQRGWGIPLVPDRDFLVLLDEVNATTYQFLEVSGAESSECASGTVYKPQQVGAVYTYSRSPFINGRFQDVRWSTDGLMALASPFRWVVYAVVQNDGRYGNGWWVKPDGASGAMTIDAGGAATALRQLVWGWGDSLVGSDPTEVTLGVPLAPEQTLDADGVIVGAGYAAVDTTTFEWGGVPLGDGDPKDALRSLGLTDPTKCQSYWGQKVADTPDARDESLGPL